MWILIFIMTYCGVVFTNFIKCEIDPIRSSYCYICKFRTPFITKLSHGIYIWNNICVSLKVPAIYFIYIWIKTVNYKFNYTEYIYFFLFQISNNWIMGPELCDMWTSIDVLCCTASILHLVAIALDR